MSKAAAAVIGAGIGLGILAFAVSRVQAAHPAGIDIESCAVPGVQHGQDIVITVALHAPATNPTPASKILEADVDGTKQSMFVTLNPDEGQTRSFTFPFSVLTAGKYTVRAI